MAAGDVFLVRAGSLAAALPERWWVPSAAHLETIVAGETLVKVLALVDSEDGGGADLWSAAAIWFAVEERVGERLGGTITASRLDRDGYLEGDSITAALDRIVDLVAIVDDGRVVVNEDRARFMLGKRVLIGITVLTSTDELVEQRQLVGTVASVHPVDGIEFNLDDGTTYRLPPDPRALEEAPPGEYRLHSTGEVVLDPDYVTTWTVHQALDADSPPDTGYWP